MTALLDDAVPELALPEELLAVELALAETPVDPTDVETLIELADVDAGGVTGVVEIFVVETEVALLLVTAVEVGIAVKPAKKLLTPPKMLPRLKVGNCGSASRTSC